MHQPNILVYKTSAYALFYFNVTLQSIHEVL
ncbi:hypothetical protein J2X77_003363 [Sphingobacterium sp. 2149]|nr:hypothetical protein [Sphingobacterium sp. 2149]